MTNIQWIKASYFLGQKTKKKSPILSNSWTKCEHFIPDPKPIFQIPDHIFSAICFHIQPLFLRCLREFQITLQDLQHLK